MATIFTDAFATLDATNWSVEFGTIGITLGRLAFTGSGAAFNWLQTKVAAHAAVLDVAVTIGPSQGGYDGGPMLRVSGATVSPTCYYLDVVEATTTAGIYRRVNGVDTLVANVTLGVAAATSDIFKFQATGSGATVTFTVFQNSVQQDTTKTDTNAARIVAAGRTGLVSWNGVTRFVNLTVEDIGGGGTVPTAIVSGTLSGSTEGDLVAGGRTLVITLTDDTFVPD